MPVVGGWVDWAVKRSGPDFKRYGDRNEMRGMALHSVEGYLNGAFGELDNPDRQASWTFTLDYDGTLYQHYVVWASPWASGNAKANTSLIPLELVGKKDEPANALQVMALMRLARDLGEHGGWTPRRSEPKTLWEHREVWNWGTPNAGPTACPSERYAPFYAALEEPVAEPQKPDEPAEVIDVRLREVMAAREALRHVASDPDGDRVIAAVATLKGRNLI